MDPFKRGWFEINNVEILTQWQTGVHVGASRSDTKLGTQRMYTLGYRKFISVLPAES